MNKKYPPQNTNKPEPQKRISNKPTKSINYKKRSYSSPSFKRGISPIVIILAIVAALSVTLLIVLFGSNNNAKDQNLPSIPTINNNQSSSSDKHESETLPGDPVIADAPKLHIEEKTVKFPSGGTVSYGYPTLTIEKYPEIEKRINKKLKELVDTKILPVVEQLKSEDVPNTERMYNFKASAGCGFYSVVVTVDTNEGITSARETFAWNFLCDSGNYADIRELCKNKYNLAVSIDSCIQNITSYDSIIHEWLKSEVVNETTENAISFYFENDNMIAVLNKRLRLDSYNRDPIKVTVPFTKISHIIKNVTED